MSKKAPYRGNDPIGGIGEEGDVSTDLIAIRNELEFARAAEALSVEIPLLDDDLRAEIETIAQAAQDWEAATYRQRFRALRILARRFGIFGTLQLAQVAAPKSMQDWIVSVRPRAHHEMSDNGARRKKWERDYLDNLVGYEVYTRMKAGQSKRQAMASMREDYHQGAPYPANGLFPPFNRPVIKFASDDAIEKRLARYRKAARQRGYADPYAAHNSASGLLEPDLKLNDIPSRGKPKSK